MKWNEFKKKLEEVGVKDDDEIGYIEVYHFLEITIEKTEGGWVIEDR